MITQKKCRLCNHSLSTTFVNLGMYPLSNSYLSEKETEKMVPFYPLHAFVCEKCFLVQLEEFETPENIFTEYSYASSYSKSWLDHAKLFTDYAIERFKLDASSQIIEVASNDGYLLQNFNQKGFKTLGIEPALNVAKIAIEKGILTLTMFFGSECAKELSDKKINADLLIGNNVLAHTPHLNDFVKGIKILLSPNGVCTLEFPHLLQLIKHNQFDTIYQEHFSYFSLHTIIKLFESHGLTLFDVQELETHGGSLRIFVKHQKCDLHPVSPAIDQLKAKEVGFGILDISTYKNFSESVRQTKRKLLSLLIQFKNDGKSVVGYGAPAKGNTLLTYCGIRTDFLDYVVDRSPLKQGKFLPGTLIPILSPEKITETRPDYVLILPWNLKAEIMDQMSHIRNWGGKFIVPIPEVKVF